MSAQVSLPIPGIRLVDPATGMITQEWYLFLSRFVSLTGTPVVRSTDDLQLLSQNDTDIESTTGDALPALLLSDEANFADDALPVVPSLQDVQDALTIAQTALDDAITSAQSILSSGWGLPTGGAVVTNFPGATATLAQCSSVLAQLITILKTARILGP